MAHFLLNLENLIKLDSPTETGPLPSSAATVKFESFSNTNLSRSSYRAYGDPFNAFNWPLNWAVTCTTSSLINIETENAFVEYISHQIAQNPIIGYPGMMTANCLGWPNLTAHNVEKYRSPFPKSTKNKILIIAETGNAWNSYSGVLSTYEYVGAENANLLVHNAFGYGIFSDPNRCTYDAVRGFFVNGEKDS